MLIGVMRRVHQKLGLLELASNNNQLDVVQYARTSILPDPEIHQHVSVAGVNNIATSQKPSAVSKISGACL